MSSLEIISAWGAFLFLFYLEICRKGHEREQDQGNMKGLFHCSDQVNHVSNRMTVVTCVDP